MIILGVLLLVLGLVLAIKILTILGIVGIAIGFCLVLAGTIGGGVGGRRNWF